ncbi:acyl-CoA N-acyltransferase [Microdochium trichocladiopsis]|uniref:Acyl-CoA N-acyltransferase n=1 Tax=Microdochium trichocladiopsis TaxID=1682393 RepID=A0A9P8YJ76_9PEZI|nr:acyl-CoA N-acyltransferase [Microdochium trichocladiopsis]KAH7040972.1 acyl-CoA N-acyltransferase [Microdochium trichocladiopsis]
MASRPEPVLTPGHTITAIETPEQLSLHLPSLRKLLQFHVNDDPSMSSIGFRAPLADDEADKFWLGISDRLRDEAAGLIQRSYFLFVLTAPDSTEVLATAALAVVNKPTHAHRAEIVKVLVHPSQQRKGLGQAIMQHVEDFAKVQLRREVLTLDTATELPAMHFYRRLGWKEWGTCPEYADFADGRRGDATFFVKIVRDP